MLHVYRTMHSIYVLVIIEPLHPPSRVLATKSAHQPLEIPQLSAVLILNLKQSLTENQLELLLWVSESDQTCGLLAS